MFPYCICTAKETCSEAIMFLRHKGSLTPAHRVCSFFFLWCYASVWLCLAALVQSTWASQSNLLLWTPVYLNKKCIFYALLFFIILLINTEYIFLINKMFVPKACANENLAFLFKCIYARWSFLHVYLVGCWRKPKSWRK